MASEGVSDTNILRLEPRGETIFLTQFLTRFLVRFLISSSTSFLTRFFDRICEADPLTAFGLVFSTGSAKQVFNRLWTRVMDKLTF